MAIREIVLFTHHLICNYHLLTGIQRNSMFCGAETIDVSRCEAEGNIDSRGSTKHTAFPKFQSISILLCTSRADARETV